MLKFLSINNVVLIEKAEIKFTRGLCILSGETGSGKSILLDALGLAIGFRSNARLVGSTQDKATVLAEFDISKNDFCKKTLAENELLDAASPDLLRIRRIIAENSASKVFVNDVAIGVNLLAKIGEDLVEIHGQHDQRGLLNPASHLLLLDEFSQNENLLKNLKKIYEEFKLTEEKIAEILAKKEQTLREKDYLEHVVAELGNADVKTNEEENLAAKKDQLIAKEKILNFLKDFKNSLLEANSNAALAQRTLSRNQNLINNFLSEDLTEFEKISEKIETQITEIDSVISSLDSISNRLNKNEFNLEEIEERLFLIRGLARKFNVKSDELANVLEDSKEKLNLLATEEEVSRDLEQQRNKLLKEYQKIAEELSQRRKKSAKILSKKIEEELHFLKMGGVKFSANLTEDAAQTPTPSGFNKVRFTASINQNSFDDISKIASGGELSRFMLALKVALIDVKSVPTMIFDEIDTGIGGSTANAVGERLKALAKNLQILVVTHQPQIAAKADTHFKISKISEQKKTKTVIEKLDEKNRQVEIARMLSGEKISDEALAAAQKLIQN